VGAGDALGAGYGGYAGGGEIAQGAEGGTDDGSHEEVAGVVHAEVQPGVGVEDCPCEDEEDHAAAREE